jgi:hypothetical protein
VRPGDTFLPAAAESHLAIVVAVCSHGRALFVRLTSLAPGKDLTCRLGPADHPWITRPTVVHYGGAMTVLNSTLDASLGTTLEDRGCVSAKMLAQVAAGFATSAHARPVDADFVAGCCRCRS